MTKELDVAGLQKFNRRLANYYLLSYAKELRAYQRQKQAFLDNNPDGPAFGAGGSRVARPTEKKAIRSLGYDERHDTYYWLKVVEVSCRNLSQRMQLFLEIRRQAVGSRNWVVYTQRHYAAALEKMGVVEPWLAETSIRHCWYKLVRDVAEAYLLLRCAKEGENHAD